MNYARHSLCEWHVLFKEKCNIITWLLLKVMFGWWTKIRACLWRILRLVPNEALSCPADSLMFCVLLVSAVWKAHSSPEYKKYQIVTKVWRKTITAACFPIYIKAQSSAPVAFFYLCLPLTPSIHTNVALWPHCSTVSMEQLGSVRSPFSLPPHTHTHDHRVGLPAFFGSLLCWSSNWIIWPEYWWGSEASSAGPRRCSMSFH